MKCPYKIMEPWGDGKGNLISIPEGKLELSVEYARRHGKKILSVGIGFDHNGKTYTKFLCDEKYVKENVKNVCGE